MTSNLEGKSALVLGASGVGGMGAAVAARLRELGAGVMISGRNAEGLRDLAADIGTRHHPCDVTREDDVRALSAATREAFGKLDFAVNCAGQAVMGDIATTSESELRRAVDVHFIGTFFFFKHMPTAIGDDGAMVTVSSVTAQRVINNHAAYVAAKAATEHLVRVAAVEYGERRIRVNSVSPGFTPDTPMTREYAGLKGLREMFEREIPLGRLNTAADVAHTVAFLCDPATYVTGENIQVNGGNALTRLPSREEFIALMKRQGDG